MNYKLLQGKASFSIVYVNKHTTVTY